MENVSGMRCETVQVVGQDGNALVINKADYDAAPDKWTLFGVEPASSAIEYDVKKDGKKFFAIDKATGTVYLDTAGYSSDVEAWTAISNANT